MSELCTCGHLRTNHFDFIERFDKAIDLSYQERVAKGFGKCQRCKCNEFKKWRYY